MVTVAAWVFDRVLMILFLNDLATDAYRISFCMVHIWNDLPVEDRLNILYLELSGDPATDIYGMP